MPAAPLAPLSGGGGVDEHMADGPKAAVGEAASGEAPQAYTAGGVPARGGGAKAALGGRGPAGRGWLACAAPLQTNGHANQPPCSGAGLAGGRGGAARWPGGRKKKQEKVRQSKNGASEVPRPAPQCRQAAEVDPAAPPARRRRPARGEKESHEMPSAEREQAALQIHARAVGLSAWPI